MGQIKNIKLHIVTDIKVAHPASTIPSLTVDAYPKHPVESSSTYTRRKLEPRPSAAIAKKNFEVSSLCVRRSLRHCRVQRRLCRGRMVVRDVLRASGHAS